MLTIVSSIFEFLKSLCNLKSTDIENKSILTVVKDKNNLKKGTNYAEQLLDITDNYTQYFSKSHLKRYNSLKKKFKKYN